MTVYLNVSVVLGLCFSWMFLSTPSEKMVIRQQIHHEAIGLTPLNLIKGFVEDPQFDEFRSVNVI